MNQYRSEKQLAYLYPIIATLSFVCCISTTVAWQHWRYVLDTCVETNCGCILHGRSTATFFTGGHVAYCHWAAYGLVLPIIFCFIFGIFHVFRVCFGRRRRYPGTATVRQRSGDVILMTTKTDVEEDDISPYYWIPASVIGSLMAVLTLVHAAMYLDGFLTTCKQQRNELIKYMQANGSLVPIIQSRISCSSVFDFMDYLHLDVSFDRHREGRINTAAALIIGLVCSWICVGLWIWTVVINAKRARASKDLRI
ncbi:uncharacterized protein LOC120900696 [Anopheles arabiensis]|uniref:AGAP010211-PA n=5 Tax=gambiae species complex TaxID=44542 RepID=Q7Q0Q6_ANOGA|nr:uncharacterized protein LOC120900696 [Anopheles arabiensis]XP_040163983.1 uncharacterized protein LOC120900696 [Anopheles arabiensis]XP_040232075.1 uncharacterized protein LOC120955328 [Anopheles coluzzii]XP_041778880.1 uncharacterized protein LOC121597298 [Anopheles merus]XP_319395.3 uncharacterized protein LOC1279633 [Anopheles gambiae]EAA14524.3 AGAP010211-PA [Anopheles gambiae str. PEST]